MDPTKNESIEMLKAAIQEDAREGALLKAQTGQQLTAEELILLKGEGVAGGAGRTEGRVWRPDGTQGAHPRYNKGGDAKRFGDPDDDDEDEDGKPKKENKKSKEAMMKKAQAVIDAATPDGLGEANAVMIDGTAMFKAFTQFAAAATDRLNAMNNLMLKAFNDLHSRLEMIEVQSAGEKKLQKAMSVALVETFAAVGELTAAPALLKGVQVVPPTGGQEGGLLAKATTAQVKGLLIKALREDIIDANTATRMMTQVESRPGQLHLLPAETQKFVTSLLGAR